MNTIYFPCGYFSPEKAASMYLSDNIVEDTVKEGFKVEVYTPTPTRGVDENTYNFYKRHKVETSMDGRLKVVRFYLYRETGGVVRRAMRYFICNFKHFCHGLIYKYDMMFVDSTPPTQGMIAGMIHVLKATPFVYNLQDIFPDSLVNNGLAKKGGLLWKIGRVIENFTYRNADKIIVISEDFKRNIMAKGVPEDKIEVIYNWVDENAVVDVPRENNDLFDKYNLDRSKFFLTYSGNIGLSQNVDLLLEVMKELETELPDIHLVLIGEGAYKKQTEEIVAREGLKNVSMLPFQPYEDISKVFSLGDVGLVISKPGTGAASVPSKTWSIMSASRPVLANFDENELKDIIANNDCGLFTKAGDKESFKQAIATLYNNRERCREMGVNGRQFILKNLTREIGTSKYVKVMKDVCGC